MSVDYFLYAPESDVAVMVGSESIAGISTYTEGSALHDFVKWAITENAKGIVFLNEDELAAMRETLGHSDDEPLPTPPSTVVPGVGK